jgi:hypothetical protein
LLCISKAGKGYPAPARETPYLLHDDYNSKPALRSQPKHEREGEKPQQSVQSTPKIQSTQGSSLQIRKLEQQNVKLQEEIISLQEDLSNTYAQLHHQSSYLCRMKEDLKCSIQEANDLKMR